LGQEKEFSKAKVAYEFYQIDESSQKITRAFRQKNAGANLMSQAVRTHKLVLKIP